MNKKVLFLSALALIGLSASTATAQTVRFGYDPAGNRIWRTIVMPSYAPQMQSGQEEAAPFVEQLTADLQVKIYPNPTSGMLNIEIIGLNSDDRAPQIAVFAQSGQQLLTLTAAGVPTTVDLSPFPAGIYVLQLTIREKHQSYNIIKK